MSVTVMDFVVTPPRAVLPSYRGGNDFQIGILLGLSRYPRFPHRRASKFCASVAYYTREQISSDKYVRGVHRSFRATAEAHLHAGNEF